MHMVIKQRPLSKLRLIVSVSDKTAPESDIQRIYLLGREALELPYPVGPNSENKPIG